VPDLARRGRATGAARVHPRAEAERETKAARALGVELVGLGEDDYPLRLQMIDDAPPLIAVRGDRSALAHSMIAIVGARNASAAGVKFAERLARELGRLCRCLRACPRHRRGGPSCQPCHRHHRGARRRP